MILFRINVWLFFLVGTLPLSISQTIPIPGGSAVIEATDFLIPAILVLIILTLPISHADIQLKRSTFRLPVFMFFLFGMASFLKGALIFPFPILLDMLLRFFKWILYYLIFELIFSSSTEYSHIKRLITAFMIGTAVTTIIGLHGYFISHNVEIVASVGDKRIESTFEGVNKYGVFLAFTFFLAFGMLFKSKFQLLTKLSIFFLLLLFFTSMIFTYSRGAWISFVAGALFAVIFNNIRNKADSEQKKISIKLIAAVGLLICGFIVAAFFLPTVESRIASIFSEDSINVGGRAERWLPFIKAWLKHPFFGTGYYSWAYLPSIKRLMGGHNQFLDLLIDVGLLGTIIFLWLHFRIFKIAIICYRSTTNNLLKGFSFGFLIGLCTILVSLFSGEFLYGSELIGAVWISIGIIYAGMEIEKSLPKEFPSL